ncbi:hypothetical protein CTAYLR_006475 [Chrysophaeum taylorii]|uniref:Sugar phosphate transporter domain-containing protein n=1 Tax=Chrysophaeum taylorii TaxID=2483200 RepID=A0AAD7ULD4_9STRA|nr:hypothetical protein CTAYLR_006475 [Chrysophaeum taylorii]
MVASPRRNAVVIAATLVVGAAALGPFGKKKASPVARCSTLLSRARTEEPPPPPPPSTSSAALTSIIAVVSGFFEFGFLWRLSLLLFLNAKFKLSEKLFKWKGLKDNYALLLFFAFWYAGNTKYNEYNKAALDAVGGKHAGMTMTVSTMQLGVCAVYAGLLWLVASNPIKLCGLQWPEAQKVPELLRSDVLATIPVGFCAAAAHSSSVFALGGDPLFGQIVKAGEPVLSAIVNTFVYKKPPTITKACCLPVIVGGVAFASMKADPVTGSYSLKFDSTALYFGLIANAFAAFKGSENKKLMDDQQIKMRYGGVGNQYAVTEILAFALSLPVMLLTEGRMFPKFVNIFLTSYSCRYNLVASGMAFYLYNELATMTIKQTGPITGSVANTAKRVIVLLYMAAITGKPLTTEQKIGATVAIGGVLVYSSIDDVISKLKDKKKAG